MGKIPNQSHVKYSHIATNSIQYCTNIQSGTRRQHKHRTNRIQGNDMITLDHRVVQI